ncbi:MAG: hypothetical protein E4H02_12695 [Lentisphaerales bacterium]|nr:MAG: hypothetical protein E4H02_12695 [Lentisphaerales bacterium]
MKEKQKGNPVLLAFLLGVILLMVMSAISPCSCGRSRTLAIRTACQSNLHQFDLALSAHCYPPVTNYPPDLSGLSSNDVCPELFVCPGSRNQAGALSNASEWMDYIYTRGLGPDTPAGVPVIICPFHEKDGGFNYLDSDRSTRWVKEPNTVVGMLEDLVQRGYEFHVSERVQRQFGGRIRSSENWGDTSSD